MSGPNPPRCTGSHSLPRGFPSPGDTVVCGWCEQPVMVGSNNLLPPHDFTPDPVAEATAARVDRWLRTQRRRRRTP